MVCIFQDIEKLGWRTLKPFRVSVTIPTTTADIVAAVKRDVPPLRETDVERCGRVHFGVRQGQFSDGLPEREIFYIATVTRGRNSQDV